MTIFKIIFSPILFIVCYILYVCMLGVIPSFLMWDITIITHTVFPWQKHSDYNVILGAVSAGFSFLSMVLFLCDD